MSIGMAVIAGKREEKLLLAQKMDEAAVQADSLGLYVNGQPGAHIFSEVARILRGQILPLDQRLAIREVLKGLGMPEALAGVIEEELATSPWPEVADSLRVDGGFSPKEIESIREIVGAEKITNPQCTRTTSGRCGDEKRCEELADHGCSECGAASCEGHEDSHPVYVVAQMNLAPGKIAELAAKGVTHLCEDCLTDEQKEAI